MCFVNFTSYIEIIVSKFRIEFQTHISGISCWEQIGLVKGTKDINLCCLCMVNKWNRWLDFKNNVESSLIPNVSPSREGCYIQIKGSVLSFRNWMWSFSIKGKHLEHKIKFTIEWHIPTFSRIVFFADTTYLSQHPLPQGGIQSRNPLQHSVPCSLFQLALMMNLLAWDWEGSQKDGLRELRPHWKDKQEHFQC